MGGFVQIGNAGKGFNNPAVPMPMQHLNSVAVIYGLKLPFKQKCPFYEDPGTYKAQEFCLMGSQNGKKEKQRLKIYITGGNN